MFHCGQTGIVAAMNVSSSQERKQQWNYLQISFLAYVFRMPLANNNLAILISSGDGHTSTEDLEFSKDSTNRLSPGLYVLLCPIPSCYNTDIPPNRQKKKTTPKKPTPGF